MRKLFVLGVSLLISAFVYGQIAIIEVQGSPQVCTGYGPSNQAKVTAYVGKTPFNYIGKHYKAYIWTAEHENGVKVWYSSQPQRWVPVPWPGQYRVHVTVEYIMPGRTRPFAAVPSNQIIITGVNCN